jgi:hypothetical protein
MSIGVPGAFDPHDPFASQKGGTYDPNALKGLYLRAQRGDNNARNYLTQLGFFGSDGKDVFAPLDAQAGNYDAPITQWAQQNGGTAFAGPSFGWQPSYVGGDPAFSTAWNNWFTGAGGTRDQTLAGQGDQTIGGQSPPLNQGPSTSGPTPGTTNWTLPDWSYGGNQLGGGTYDQRTGRWTPGKPLAAGSDVFGAKLPAAYDGTQDRGQMQLNGQNVETFWSKMLRFAKDAFDAAQRNRQPITAEAAMTGALARLKGDNGGTLAGTGFTDPGNLPAAGGQQGQGGQQGGQQGQSQTWYNPVTGQTQTATGGANQTLRNIALLNNPDQALAVAMRRLGLDPTRQGLYTSSIANTLSPALQAQMQLNGLYGDRNAIDTAEQTVNEFTGQLQRPGGFGALNQQAQGLLSDPRFGGLAGKLGDQQAINLMQTILSQAYAGRNKIYNQARLNQFNAAYGPGGQYAQESLDNLGNPNFPRPVEWLQGSDFADLLNTY